MECFWFDEKLMQAVQLQDAQAECQFVKKKQMESAEFNVERNTIEMANIAHTATTQGQFAKNAMDKDIARNVF